MSKTLSQIREDIIVADEKVRSLHQYDRAWFESWKSDVNRISWELWQIVISTIQDEDTRNKLVNLLNFIEVYIYNNNDLDRGSDRERYLHRTLVNHFIDKWLWVEGLEWSQNN